MRIVAGRHKSRPLRTPVGANTRPTSDRVREALFGALGTLGMLRDAAVLDVFAGSGALGLEALSRGAVRATFVEKAGSAAKVIQENITALGEDAACAVMVRPAQTALRDLVAGAQTFDLIFADPPYPLSEPAVSAVLEAAAPLLFDDSSLIVLERSVRSPQPILGDGLRMYDIRTWGETAVYLIEAVPQGEAGATPVDGERS